MTMLLRITVFVVLCICAAQCTEEDERTFGSYSCLWNSRYRNFDGTCNNLLFPAVGAAGQLFRRGGEGAEYNSDGSPVSDRPIERVVSNKVSRDDPALLDPIPHSMVATQFGQFVNHDMNLNAFDDPDTLVYPDVLHVPEKDDSFCMVQLTPTNFTKVNVCVPPYNQVPPYNRPPLFTTKFSLRTTVQRRPEVYNLATAWIDLSQVYGTSGSVATLLRTGTGGKLLTRDYTGVTTSPSRTFGFFEFGMGPTPPYSCLNCLPSWGQLNGQVRVPPLMDPTKVTNFVYDPHKIFVAGDERAGENGALSMFHTLFLRNHNRHATRIAQQQPNLSDEEIFQRARRRNIAEYQKIVMYDYVPAEFGDYFAGKIGRYRGYNPFVDADTNIAFATAAFRYGHSTFRNYVPINQCGAPTMFGMPAGNAKLMFGGTTGGPILPMDVYGSVGSWENLIRGLIASRTGPNDVMIDSNLRDLPFGFPFAGGTDIWVLDLHRARENGIPNYVALQKEYGKRNARIYGARGCPERYARNNQPDPQECFDALVPYNKTLAENLRALYVKVNRIDALMGLLAEVHVRGSSFGETLGTIMMDTYKRARDGDRFWFENRFQPFPFTERELDDIKDVGLDDLFRLNFNFPSSAQVPGNPFFSPSRYLTTLSRTQGCS